MATMVKRMRKVVGADPYKVRPICPLDFKCVNGVWVYEKDWWKKIQDKPKKGRGKNNG